MTSNTERRTRARVLTAAILLAFSAPASAYRTGGDTPELSDTRRVVWRAPPEFVLHGDVPSELGSSAAFDAVRRALLTWEEPACSGLRWSLAGTTEREVTAEDWVNTIQWVRDWTDRGYPVNQPATTDLRYQREPSTDEWGIVEADILLNAEHFDWSPGDATDDRRSALAVLTHELGHAAGLLHPCEPAGRDGAPDCASGEEWTTSAVYPIYSSDQADLAEDDVDGICFLYSADPCPEGCAGGFTCTDDGCRKACGEKICAQHERCDGNQCVPACIAPGCSVGDACQSGRDCHVALSCQGEVCSPGRRRLGDPCDNARECASMACSVDGHCSLSCESDADCDGAEGSCKTTSLGTQFCEAVQKPLGSACEESNDCLGGQCLDGYAAKPLCTRLCESSDSEACPLDWSCQDVESRLVCVPPVHARCSVVERGPWQHSLVLLALALCVPLRRFRVRALKRIDASRRCRNYQNGNV